MATSATEHSEQIASSTATKKTAKEARTKKAKGASKSQSAHKLTAKGDSKTSLVVIRKFTVKKTKKSVVSPVATHKSTVKKAKGDSKSEASLVTTRKSTIKTTKDDSKSVASPVTTRRSTAKKTKGTASRKTSAVPCRKTSTTKLTKSPLSKRSPGHNRKLKSPKKSIVKSKLSPVSENDNSKNLDMSEPGTSEKSLVISKLSTGGENDNSKNLDTSEPDSSLNSTSESMWIPNLGLFNHDREVLLSESWLNDNIVYATENLLSQQTKDANIYGWQSPQLVKTKFKVLPPNCKYIQVLNVHKSHWITISNINIHDDIYTFF